MFGAIFGYKGFGGRTWTLIRASFHVGSSPRISLFLPYERNTEQVRMPTPVGSGGLG